MVVENEQHYQFTDFQEANTLPSMDEFAMMDVEPNPEEQKEINFFATTGIIAALAGAAAFIASNIGAAMDWLTPLAIGAGIVAAGIGGLKLLGRAFKKSVLELPKIKVNRKTELRSAPVEASPTFGSFKPISKRLARSTTDKVITGVCGGLAAHSGISATLIRVLFIAAFAMTSGAAVFVYLMASILMPKDNK